MSDNLLRWSAKTANAHIFNEMPKARLVGLSPVWIWRGRVLFSDFSDSDTSESLNIRTLFANTANPLPTNIAAGEYWLDLREVFAGGTVDAADMILGRSGDDNAYVTTTDVFTGADLGVKDTPGAAEYPFRKFPTGSNLAPLLQLDTNAGNIDTLTSGVVDVCLYFRYLPHNKPA